MHKRKYFLGGVEEVTQGQYLTIIMILFQKKLAAGLHYWYG